MSVSPAKIHDQPLDPEQADRVDAALSGLSAAQLTWVSGYAAGLAAANAGVTARPAPDAAPGRALTVLYGSQTGNGEAIARELEAQARDAGFAVTLKSLAEFKPSKLKRETLVSLVVSTHGEGDPPDDAELFHEVLMSEQAPRLEGLKYTVLALGDSSYVDYCATGREFDARLAELGAERLLPIVECDIDYEAAAGDWTAALLARLPELLDADTAVPRLRAVSAPARYDRKSPFAAEVLVNQKITGGASDKDVRHIELSLEGSGITYEPGDALAVVVENPPALVDELLDALALDGDTGISVGDAQSTLRAALRCDLEITALNLGFLRQWAGHSGSGELAALTGDDRKHGDLAALIETHQVIDVVRRFPAAVDAQAFVDALRRLSPRSYSIASSLAANPDEVHLTVAAVRYRAFGREHWGAASTHLADRINAGDTLNVFVEPNKRFRLPADDATDIVMIGPGTGVAPFRAFVEERVERGAAGRNWLIFGDRTFSNDFLYQLEWQRHLKSGALDRLDVAFSRDQAEKVYVQHRIVERGAEVYAWLEAGAHLYVCGDAKHMAGDVDAALATVIAEHAGIDRDSAVARLKELRQSGRYQRDVY